MATTAIGLDIGSSAVRAVQLSGGGRGPVTLDRLGQVLLPPGAVRDGEVVDPDPVVEALQILMKRYKFKGKRVALGVANQQVVVRVVDLPALPQAQLRESLAFQVQDYIPIPVDEAQLDFEILDEFSNVDGTEMMRVLLVAAASQMVSAVLDVVKRAKLEPVLLDLDAFAMLRSLVAAQPQLGPGEGELVIDAGSTVTNICVHEAGKPRFVRILLMGGLAITESLQSAFGMQWEEAEVTKATELTPGSGEAQLVGERAQRFVEEIRGSLDYYRAQGDAIPVRRAVISGGTSLMPGLADRLGEALRLPIERGHPMQELAIGKVGLEPEQLSEAEPFLAVAIGLALGALE